MMKKIVLLIGFLIFAGVMGVVFAQGRDIDTPLVSPQESIKSDDRLLNSPSEEVRRELGKVATRKRVDSYPREEVKTYLASYVGRSGRVPRGLDEVTQYTITYKTTYESNKITENTAQIYIPDNASQRSLPIYVFGSGTTGINDACAPSREIASVDNWGDYKAHMLSYASQGYIVVFPDYEGFHDGERIHHYFHKAYEGPIMLDAARAVYDFLEQEEGYEQPQDAIFFTGYSQGGHAAFAARDMAGTYAPELEIKGIIGYAPTTNVLRLMKESPHLAAYIVEAYRDTYGDEVVRAEDILQQRWLATLTEVTNKCVSEVGRYYPSNVDQIYTERFAESMKNDHTDDFERFRDALLQNTSGLTDSDIPGLILQGGADPIVTNATQEQFLKESCDAGNSMQYRNYPGVHHFQTRQVSFMDALDWMNERIAGSPVKNDC